MSIIVPLYDIFSCLHTRKILSIIMSDSELCKLCTANVSLQTCKLYTHQPKPLPIADKGEVNTLITTVAGSKPMGRMIACTGPWLSTTDVLSSVRVNGISVAMKDQYLLINTILL